MSFIQVNEKQGQVYAPGYFLANNEDCDRFTFEASASNDAVVTTAEGKYLPMGTIYPANGATAQGIVYEDVDVTSGNMPGSLVTRGVVIVDRLPEEPVSDAITALNALGITFVEDTSVTRPY
jgi:hypothetical protein